MLKRILYIFVVLLIALWAAPAQAGCYYDCSGYDYPYYDDYYYSDDYYSDYYSDQVFGDWYGVDNRYQTNNPFGDWYGVNNQGASNPFGDWYGVNNSGASNPFGDWYGVNSSTGYNSYPGWYSNGNGTTSSTTFGDWYGVDNRYSTVAPRSAVSSRPPVAYQSYTQPPVDYSYQRTNNYRVAPTTGINKAAPFAFAGLLAAGLFVFRQRRWLFN